MDSHKPDSRRAPDATALDWIGAASRLTEVISTQRGLQDAASGVLRALGDLLGWEAGALWGMAGAEPATVHLLATWSAQPGALAEYEAEGPKRRLERGRDVAGWAWEAKHPAVLGDVPATKTGVEARVRQADGIAAWLAIPLTYGDRVRGMLELVRRAPIHGDEVLRRGALVVGRLLGEFAGREDTFNALERTKTALADLTDHAPLGISLIDARGLVQRTNRAQLAMLGFARAEFVGERWADFMESEDARALWARLHEARTNDAVITSSVRLRCRDGTWKSAELMCNAVWSETGHLRSVRVLARDVTDVLHAGAALAATEQRFQYLLDGVRDYSLHTLDPQGLIESWNKGAERLFGFAEVDVLGRHCEMLYKVETGREQLAQRMLRLAVDEGRFEFECLRQRKDGSSFWAAVTYTCQRDAQGVPIEISVLTQDITQRRRLEGLRRRSADLEQANRGVIESARRSADLMRQVVAALERPLESLREAVERAREQTGARASSETAAILGAGEKLAKAARALSGAGSSIAEELGSASAPVDLVRVATEARDLLREQASERRVRIEIDVDPALADVTVDADILAQVAYNLLAHGVWASRERGRATVRALPEGPEDFRLEVEDTGIGLSAAEARALFDVPGSVEAGGERALGLPATRRLVEEHGGRVGVDTAPGRGSVVFAVLRRAPRARHERQDEGEGEGEGEAARTRRRVLVVSENVATRANMCWTLGRTPHEVLSAGAVDEALHIAREQRCDVVAVDLLLEAMPPSDFVARLRAEGLSRDTPRVVAALGAPGVGVVGIAAADLLPRPVPGDRLYAALERAHVPRGRESRILVVDGDLGTCKAVCRTLEVLDYAAVPEVDAHGALKACAESPPAAILLAPFLQGMNVFTFLHHLHRSERSRAVPVLLLVPRTWSESQLAELREAAADAAEEGVQRQLERCIDDT